MSERSTRPGGGVPPRAPGRSPAGHAPDTDTFDDLVRACRALNHDPGLAHAAETHRRVVRRARALQSSGRV